MSPNQLKALKLVAANNNTHISGAMFASWLWPDSPAWEKRCRVGRGTAMGVGIKRAGGAVLGRLERAGLISTQQTRFSRIRRITMLGTAALEAAEQDNRCKKKHQI